MRSTGITEKYWSIILTMLTGTKCQSHDSVGRKLLVSDNSVSWLVSPWQPPSTQWQSSQSLSSQLLALLLLVCSQDSWQISIKTLHPSAENSILEWVDNADLQTIIRDMEWHVCYVMNPANTTIELNLNMHHWKKMLVSAVWIFKRYIGQQSPRKKLYYYTIKVDKQDIHSIIPHNLTLTISIHISRFTVCEMYKDTAYTPCCGFYIVHPP